MRFREFHITKHDGRYESFMNDWLSFQDIGDTFNGSVLTQKDYETAEALFLSVIRFVFDRAEDGEMQIRSLEDQKQLCPFVNTYWIRNPVDLQRVSVDCLRGKYWFRLNAANTYVYFGGDYDLYIGTADFADELLAFVSETDLYVYEVPSEHAPPAVKPVDKQGIVFYFD